MRKEIQTFTSIDEGFARKYHNYVSYVKRGVDKAGNEVMRGYKGVDARFVDDIKVRWKNGRDLPVYANFNGTWKTFVVDNNDEFCIAWDMMSSIDFNFLGSSYEDWCGRDAKSKYYFIGRVILPQGASEADIAKVSDSDVKKFFDEAEDFNITLNRDFKNHKVIRMHKIDNSFAVGKLTESVYSDTKNSYCPLYALQIPNNDKGMSKAYSSILRFHRDFAFSFYGRVFRDMASLNNEIKSENIKNGITDILRSIFTHKVLELVSK